MKNFKNAIKTLDRQRAANLNIHSFEVDTTWTLIFSPITKRYYAMDMTSANCIRSTVSCIRPAFRIDPETGNAMTKDGKPRKFAVKIFSGEKRANRAMADNELAALNENQPSDSSLTNEGQPIIIMDFHAGETICDVNGSPNPSLKRLSLKDRLALIFQVVMQFFEMHVEKIHKKPRIHVDVKGSNILMHVPEGGPVNARVIDFGSSKVLDDSGKVGTGLHGVTPMTLPPEAVKDSKTQYVNLQDVTGVLNSKSDLYSLGSVFAAMLGATDPYATRRGEINTQYGYDLQALSAQIASGFDFTGVLSDAIPKLPFEIHTNSQPCAFRNLSAKEAPNNDSILTDPLLPALGYILYKDQLLYVDKGKQKVSGRERAVKLREFNGKVSQIRNLADTDALIQIDLARCIAINNAHPQDKIPLDNVLRPLLQDFLQQIVDQDHTKRPSTEEALRFFTVANKLACMATVKDSTRTNAEIELRVKIAILQLNIILYKGWHLKLPLLLPDNTRSKTETGSFSEFDFDLLEQDSFLLNQLCQVFYDPEILEGRKPLTPDTFNFLPLRSEKKKLFDAIATKLKVAPVSKTEKTVSTFEDKQEAKHPDGKRIMDLLSRTSKEPSLRVEDKKQAVNERKLHAPVLPVANTLTPPTVSASRGYGLGLLEEKTPLSSSEVKKADSTRGMLYDEKQDVNEAELPTLSVANKFLSLSRPMMVCLLEEELPADFNNNFNLKREFLEYQQFIKADFPGMFGKMRTAITDEGLGSIETLRTQAPEIALFLSHDLNDPLQVDELLKHQCQVERDKPLTPQSEAKLFALYKQMLRYKADIEKATSARTLAKLIDVLAQPLSKKLNDYIEKLTALKTKGVTYQRWSFFGAFGYKVSEKSEVATDLAKAFTTGDLSFLEKVKRNKAVRNVLTTKNLGAISESYLSCLEGVRRPLGHRPKPTI